MNNKTQPTKIYLNRDEYNKLYEILRLNEKDYVGEKGQKAKELQEKIVKFGLVMNKRETDEEEKAAHTLARRDDPLSCLRKHIPQMLDVMREKIKIPKFGGVCYSIPGTIYQAELSLDQVWDKWFVQARMRKRNSA